MVSHRCGGGTERHVNELASSLLAEGVRTIFVRPSGSGHVFWEERAEDGGVTWCRRSTGDLESVGGVLRAVRPMHAHVHHVMGLPDDFIESLRAYKITYDFTVHDYYSICPRVNLIGAGGTYCREPDAASCDRCLALLGDDQGRRVAGSIASWRERHGRSLAGARRVFAPSEDARRRLARYFPDLRVLHRPHPEALPLSESLAAQLSPGEKVRVAVVGTIVAVKGSARLLACARNALARKLPLEFHIIGSTDRDAVFSRLHNVHVSGRYQERDIYTLLARARCHLVLLPSLCPESFMYTLSIAMAARLFVLCFDLGAQAERLRAWGWGQVLEIDAGPEAINDSLVAAARSLAIGRASPPAPPRTRYSDILRSYYDFAAAEIAAFHTRARDPDRRDAPDARFAPWRDHAHIH